MAGMMVALVALFAVSCASSTSSLPAYTPTPADLYKAYSAAIDDLDAALDDLKKARSNALSTLEAAPEIALSAVQEARDCNVPIDALVNDPRDSLTSIGGILADPQLAASRDAPRIVAQDLAAAHIASPANRDAVEAARDAHVRSQLLDRPTPDSPVFDAYLAYLRQGDDSAFAAYLSALDEVNDAYFPVDERLNTARTSFVSALIQLPGKASPANCARALLGLYDAYMIAFEVYRPTLNAYFDGIGTAIEKYARALELARAPYAER